MSPVVGVTLLVGILLLLSVVTGTMVLELGQEREPAPDVVFETEATDAGPGLLLVHRGGTVLAGENVELRGVARPEDLPAEFRSGDRHRVFPTSERVQVVWHGDRASYVIWEFDAGSGGVAPPDEGCAFVDSRTNDGTSDFSASDLTVGCTIETSGQIDTDNVTVYGDVRSTGSSVDADDSDYYGSLVGVGDTDVANGTVTGRVDSGGQVDLDDAAVGGPVDASGQVDLDVGSVDGSITSQNGDVDVADAAVEGAIASDGQVDADDATVAGGVDAGGQVDVDGGSVGGRIDAGGDVQVAGATVGGAVETTGQVDLDAATVRGDVYAEGQVDLDDATVEGDVYADPSDLQCTNTTVSGQDCSTYSPKDPDDY